MAHGALLGGVGSIMMPSTGGNATTPAPYDHFTEQEAVDFFPDPFGGKQNCEIIEFMINVLRAQIAWRKTDLNINSATYPTHVTRIAILTKSLRRLEDSYLNICGRRCPI
jgi:hypothetical protein